MQNKTDKTQSKDLRKPRSFKASDYEWGKIQENAKEANMNTSEFIRERATNNPGKAINQANKAIDKFKEAIEKI